MTTFPIELPPKLQEAATRRMQAMGVGTAEAYLLQLVEDDCAQEELERVLLDRMDGPFVPLEDDWMDRVRETAMKKLASEA